MRAEYRNQLDFSGSYFFLKFCIPSELHKCIELLLRALGWRKTTTTVGGLQTLIGSQWMDLVHKVLLMASIMPCVGKMALTGALYLAGL